MFYLTQHQSSCHCLVCSVSITVICHCYISDWRFWSILVTGLSNFWVFQAFCLAFLSSYDIFFAEHQTCRILKLLSSSELLIYITKAVSLEWCCMTVLSVLLYFKINFEKQVECVPMRRKESVFQHPKNKK